MISSNKIKWVFFGSSHFSVIVLHQLETLGLVPDLIVTTPDKARGRGLKIMDGEVKMWATQRNIRVLAPDSLKNSSIVQEIKNLGSWDVFLIASYGKIVPNDILHIPSKETLNIHPSLLPKLRGPSPIQSAILYEKESKGIGVTIMKVDEQVDHGAIVAQRVVPIPDWPAYYLPLEKILAEEGAKLFAEILPDWIHGKIEAKEQDHTSATFTKKITKEDLLMSLDAPAEENLRKIRAFTNNRGAYFLNRTGDQESRLIVTKAKKENDNLVLETVKPEGKKEMDYESYKRGLK